MMWNKPMNINYPTVAISLHHKVAVIINNTGQAYPIDRDYLIIDG